jgi:hypothetical protein
MEATEVFGRKAKKTNDSLSVLKSVKLQDQSNFQQVSLDKSHVSLVKTQEAAKVSLRKRGLEGKKFAVGIIVDNSGSMGPWHYDFYSKGYVQTLTEFALGYAFEVDTDGLIPVGVFGDGFQWASEDLEQHNYKGFVQRQGWNGNGGGTNTGGALENVQTLFDQSEDPNLIVVVTDGIPNSKAHVIQQLEKMSCKPYVVKWLIVGDDAEALKFGKQIDDELAGLVDNVDVKNYTGRDLANLTPEKFAEDMSDELDTWEAAARLKRILL